MRDRLRAAADVIASVLGRVGVVERELREHRLLTHWAQVVGERVAQRSSPDGLSKGVLWVRVANPAWLHELSFLRAQVIERANQLVGDPPLVVDVKFHVGARTGADDDDALAPTVRIRRSVARPRPLPPPASGDRLARIEAEAAAVEDDELRAIIVDVRRRLDL
jgi:hypothetical protein